MLKKYRLHFGSFFSQRSSVDFMQGNFYKGTLAGRQARICDVLGGCPSSSLSVTLSCS